MNRTFTLIISCLLLSFSSLHAQSWEVYDTKLKLQARLMYQEIELLSETVRIGKTDSAIYLLSPDLKPAVSLEGNEIYQYLAPWILVKGKDGIGAFHEYGQKVLPLEYEAIDTYFNLLLARKGNEYWLFERGKNKTTYLGELDEAKITKTGLIYAKRGAEYFFPISNNPDKTFQLLQDNGGDYLLAKEESGYGLINREGDYVLEPIIDSLEHTKGNFYYGYDQDQYLLIEGNDIKSNIRYNSFHRITFENDILLEYIHGKLRRVMEEDGILLDAVGMTQVNKIGNDLYNVYFRDNKVGLLGKSGWLVNPTGEAESIRTGAEGFFPALKDGSTGFLNTAGQWAIEPKFAEVSLFSENIAGYKSGASWGVINSSGEVISDATWQEIKPFQKGFAIAKANNEFFLINSFGSPVNSTGYDHISRTSEGFFLVEKSGKTGMLNSKGEPLIPAEFESLRRERKDFIIAQKDGMTGIINEAGDLVLPLAYDEVLVDWSSDQIFIKTKFVPVVIQAVEEPSKKNKKGA